ncbi:uncharacterized protein LOC135198780 isoform X1 [Macrobrachium nipponense]|uniref:uncharacterized protein LOC135198780 isoform X1 n=2 Tax=Macrobrachium nipponense TaxID=159736 RepID=UPI0030C896F8
MARETLVSKPPWLKGNIVMVGLLLFCGHRVTYANNTNNGTLQKSTCNQRDCLRCDLDTAECVKCLYVMMADSRVCHSACPPGYSTTWAPYPAEGSPAAGNAVMGRICSEQSMLALVSGRDVGIIAGAAVAGAVCVGVVIGALLYMRRRTKPPPDHQRHDHPRHVPPRLWKDKRPNATEVSVAGEERAEFLEQLKSLRGEADNFLEMLSETRNRFRRLGGPDSATDTKAKAYRAVVRDLSRVLTLLNRREEHIVTVPADWRRLLSWAARVLARYKRQKAAKEAGDIPSLEPLSTGGTLYQTRKQAQAERCRLVALGAPCSTLSSGNLNSSRMSCSSRGSDPPTPCRETPPASQISSRSASMISLTPVIFEEEDEEAPENPEDILFDESLDTTPPSMKKSDNQDAIPDNDVEKQDLKVNGKVPVVCENSTKDESDIPSVHLDPMKDKDSKFRHYLEGELAKRGVPVISQDEALCGFKYVKETNNNITKKMNDLNDLCSIISDGYINAPSVIESLKNLRNIEHMRNADDSSSPYLNMERKLLQSQYKNQKFTHDIHEKEKEVNSLKSPPVSGICTDIGTPEPEAQISVRKDPVRGSVRGDKTSSKCDKINATLPGEDVYLNVIRKPVVARTTLSNDPYRDDTIDSSQEIKHKNRIVTKNSKIAPVSCKAEVTRHLSAPRCELTTEL